MNAVQPKPTYRDKRFHKTMYQGNTAVHVFFDSKTIFLVSINPVTGMETVEKRMLNIITMPN